MERLTQRIKNGDFAMNIIDNQNDVMDNYIMACDRLADYEDTGLTPEQIVSLKKRDTAKAPSYQDENFGYFVGYFECPNCGMAIYTSDDLESHHFCLNCGQRIKWKENIDGE